MVFSSPDGPEDVSEEKDSSALIDRKAIQIIGLLGKEGEWDMKTTPFTKLGHLSVRLVDIPQAGIAQHLASDQNLAPKDQVMIEIIDHSDSKKPLNYSFLNNISKGIHPYFNTVCLETSEYYTVENQEEYMPLLDLVIEGLRKLRATGTE